MSIPRTSRAQLYIAPRAPSIVDLLGYEPYWTGPVANDSRGITRVVTSNSAGAGDPLTFYEVADNDKPRNQIGPAIAEYLGTRTQQWLADQLGTGQTNVSRWIKQQDGLRPSQVFAIEEALELPPGTLSRLEDPPYVPADVKPARSPEDAISGDQSLTANQRDALLDVLAAYRVVNKRRGR